MNFFSSILLFLLPLLKCAEQVENPSPTVRPQPNPTGTCIVIFFRFSQGEFYVAKGPITAPTCSYVDILDTMNQMGRPVGPHHVLLNLAANGGRVLVTDTESVQNEAYLWLPVEREKLERTLKPIDNTFEGRYKTISPIPVLDTRSMVRLNNVKAKTCYLNSLLQCLYHIPEFTDRLERLVQLEDKETISGTLNTVFNVMKKCANHQAPSLSLMEKLVLRINAEKHDLAEQGILRQSDSSEVLRFLLDHLNSVLTKGGNLMIQTSVFDDLFAFRIVRKTYSHRSSTTRFELLDGNVMLLRPSEEIANATHVQPRQPKPVVAKVTSAMLEKVKAFLVQQPSLINCMQDRYPEVYSALQAEENDASYVPSVEKRVVELATALPELSLLGMIAASLKEDTTMDTSTDLHVLATTTTPLLLRLPPYLFLAVDRAPSRFRINNPITFPITNMDLTAHMALRTADGSMMNQMNDGLSYTYDLKAFVMHIGQSTFSGHYTAMVKNEETGLWHLLNDAVIGAGVALSNGQIPLQYMTNATYFLYKRHA